jgi:hypothetical protein
MEELDAAAQMDCIGGGGERSTLYIEVLRGDAILDGFSRCESLHIVDGIVGASSVQLTMHDEVMETGEAYAEKVVLSVLGFIAVMVLLGLMALGSTLEGILGAALFFGFTLLTVWVTFVFNRDL